MARRGDFHGFTNYVAIAAVVFGLWPFLLVAWVLNEGNERREIRADLRWLARVPYRWFTR